MNKLYLTYFLCKVQHALPALGNISQHFNTTLRATLHSEITKMHKSATKKRALTRPRKNSLDDKAGEPKPDPRWEQDLRPLSFLLRL